MKKLKKLSGMRVVSGSPDGWKGVQSEGGVTASAVQVMKKYKLISNDKISKKNRKNKVKKLKGPVAPALISQAKLSKDNSLIKPKRKKKKKVGENGIKAQKDVSGDNSKSPSGVAKESEGGTTEDPSLSMSAWNDMFVHPLVLKGTACH